MLSRILFLLILSALTLSACGGGQPAAQPASGGAAAGAGNATNGKALFEKSVIGNTAGCATCHSLEKGKVLVGPSMAGVATEAATIIKSADYKGTAKTVEDYLRESIVNPDAYVTKGFQAGLMPKDYSKLSAQEINDLVAYLATLK